MAVGGVKVAASKVMTSKKLLPKYVRSEAERFMVLFEAQRLIEAGEGNQIAGAVSLFIRNHPEVDANREQIRADVKKTVAPVCSTPPHCLPSSANPEFFLGISSVYPVSLPKFTRITVLKRRLIAMSMRKIPP